MKQELDRRTVEHYDSAREKGSTGALNSKFEVAVRRAMARDGEGILYAQKAGRVDARVGRGSWIEIKSCCSETGNDTDPLAAFRSCKYVLYTPDLPDEYTIDHDAVACLETCLIFTTEQFLDMLAFIHKGGKELHIRRTPRGRWNIAALRVYSPKTDKWSEKPYERFWTYVRANEIQNASLEWVDSVRH